MIRGILYIIFILINVLVLRAEDTESYKLSSYEGLHFMVGFMENEATITAPSKNLEQKIFVSSNYNATVMVKFGTLSPETYSVSANELLTINVPVIYENKISEVPSSGLIEITSDFPIAVYAYSSMPLSTDSYAVIPVSNWGNEYIAVSLPNDQYNAQIIISPADSLKNFTPRSSQIMVMAAYDDTKITLIPSSLTRQAKQVGQSYEITLNKGQCYLVQSWQYARGLGDLTGTIVRSDKPVGFLTGHVRTALLQGFTEQPPDSKDHLIEMLMPTSAWGNTFVTVPFGTNPEFGDYFKIVTKEKNLVIDLMVDGKIQQIQLYDKTSYVVEGLNRPAYWRASAPMQVAQFMYRSGDTSESYFYDPSLVIIPPVEQFVSRILFNTPDESFVYADGIKFNNHYVTVVVEDAAIPHLRLDGILITTLPGVNLERITGTNLQWARIEILSGKHELLSSEGRFAGVLFGVGRFDSYAMTLGCSLQNPYKDDDVLPTISVTDDCGKIRGTITDEISENSFGIYYAWVQTFSTFNFKWTIDPIKSDDTIITFTAEPIDKFKDGTFVIDYQDKSGNKGRYIYRYDAIKIDYPKEIVIPDIDYFDSLCVEVKIKNNGKRAIEFIKTQITNDSRVKLYNANLLPDSLQPGEEVILLLCFDPDGNSSSFYGKINLFFGCNTEFEIPYRGDLIALELTTQGLDFGEVQIGKRNCGAVSIKNNGNADVLLTELEFADLFELDTLGVFPYKLIPDETLYIPVCFEPKERKNYFDNVIFKNEYNINKSADIRGVGVAPLLNSLVFDFGKFRIGSLKTLVQDITNSGNQNATLTFEGFTEQSHADDGLSDKLAQLDGTTINKSESYTLSLDLVIPDKNVYSITASYKTNWELHPELTISAIGQGTIPEIRTQDVNFGTIPIFTEKELTPEIIFSEGNEILTIDEVYIVDGDEESFIIDLESMKNFTISENTSYSSAIIFRPIRIGFHELTLGVIHDAKINFLRDTAYITIVGNAVTPDSYDVEISLDTDIITACRYALGTIRIHNSGKKVLLTGLELIKSNDDFSIELLGFSERYLETGETAEYKVRIFAENGKGGTVKVEATFFETEKLFEEFEISPISEAILVDNLQTVSYAAGDTVVLKISGSFPHKIDTLTSFYLSLEMKNSHLWLVDENISLILNEFSENLKYNLNISKTKDKLEFFLSEDLINIFQNLEWSVELRFLGLLSENISGNWSVVARDGKCFDTGTNSLRTILDSVCVFDARHVFVDAGKAHANIYPNPTEDKLRIKTIFPQDVTNAKISISNNLGINYSLAENVIIRKGTDYLEFDVSNFSNGTYFLKFESDILQKNILFVIIR